MAAAWKFLENFLMNLTKSCAFSMQNTKLLENCCRNNVQQTNFLKVKRHFGGFKKLFFETYKKSR